MCISTIHYTVSMLKFYLNMKIRLIGERGPLFPTTYCHSSFFFFLVPFIIFSSCFSFIISFHLSSFIYFYIHQLISHYNWSFVSFPFCLPSFVFLFYFHPSIVFLILLPAIDFLSIEWSLPSGFLVQPGHFPDNPTSHNICDT